MLRRNYLLLTMLLLASTSLMAQTRGQKKYLSDYEKKTMNPAETPVLLPYNKWIDPVGTQIFFGNKEQENHALDVALSPDGKWLAVEGRYEVVLISAESQKIVSTFNVSEYFKGQVRMNTFSGICWRSEEKQTQLFWGSVGKENSAVVKVNVENGKFGAGTLYPFPKEDPAQTSLVNEVLYRNESGTPALYVVLNGNNKVVRMNPDSGEVVWSVAVGVAPFGITYANGKLYVTNWAGGTPEASDAEVAGVPWGKAKVSALNGSTREGSVSVLDPASGKIFKEIGVGLHPNDITTGSDQKFVYVANANSDNVSVISTATDEVTETISVRLNEEENPYWGDSPNGLALSVDGQSLFVCNGMDNALAVVRLGNKAATGATLASSQLAGFIPTAAYPAAVVEAADHRLWVANLEAEGSRIPFYTEGSKNPKYNSHKEMASVSVIAVPERKDPAKLTERVKKANQHFRLDVTARLPRKKAEPVPVPERIGEPSPIKHILYIIKENRTYDQVLGDMKQGDGDSTLTIYGNKITPNMHKLCQDFLHMDNYYVSGKCSAEGHQWTDASIVTDYVEKSVRAWIRSYPHVQYDALVYSPTGFIWDNALAHGKSVKIYGEACECEFEKGQTWTSIYKGFLNKEPLNFKNITTIKPVEAILSQTFPSSDNHMVSDVQRASIFIKELKELEEQQGDKLPELMIMALSNDHTSGTRPGIPTPRAMVADNDLAVAQIIEALTKSRFWQNTAIFITEDDSQDGWDHVSAYRTVGTVISPYTRSRGLVHTHYNQVSMVRTIEQILGIPPMNILDATAMPMFDCFTAKPDLTPYKALPNNIPLDEMNPELKALKGTALRYARRSMEPQFDGIDDGDEELFNKILWFTAKGKTPYPKIRD
ncbi:MAG: bifunctional YncE family protein/alkaline phosphatase family protein [Marinilabiliales bacterium]|nr:bifunctional YncE family protein/alkaline phosphatase family protein [Marinilabiliales bacterium]